ncbi:class I SAM-dependent rRNA methyltransferase [Halobacillus shinanisalinarum]|uniref:Class I SAM-dependent rRNA methyltransferase n=1 Tax=Halobacillus shinanisalinarum TaxID=2932258 RepID=A0ABY4H734_9BACI|nr:class I SAM-dependent rRNA methyltransferase [Halobacillus shinanisalinarum]UOQ95387.1 class I SAM-dependent rRNA methyltransferase [Halobacillus shinanisalinarum]
MSKEIKLKITDQGANKYRKGYPLLRKDAIVNRQELQVEGTIMKLVDERGQFIGKAYYGKQNKGYGWVVTRNEAKVINGEFFNKKLKKALKDREHLFKDTETTAFRIFNGEGDGIGGFTVDYFAGYLLVNWYSEGIYSFRNYVIESLKRNVEFNAIYQKKRFGKQGQYIEEDEFVVGERGEFPIIVKENGVNFAVYLNEGAMVGIFLDQRAVRKTIRDQYADGKNVLNMFSYTGAFSVYAALGGAAHTTSVDLANRSYGKTVENFSLNDIDYEAQDIIVDDVFKYFKYAKRKGKSFDLVILDPPSFARSKKFTFRAEKDYTNLLKETIAITEKKAVIVASTNCSKFNMKRFKTFIAKAFKESSVKYKLLEEYSLPEDYKTIPEFKEGDYLKVVFIKKL